MIDPKIFLILAEKSQAAADLNYGHESYDSYIALLRYYEAAIKRVPSLKAAIALDCDSIEDIIGAELEYLHELLFRTFFASGGVKEFYDNYGPAYEDSALHAEMEKLV